VKKFVVSFFSALLLSISFISVLPVSALTTSLDSVSKYIYNDVAPSLSDDACDRIKKLFSSSGYNINNYYWCIFANIQNDFYLNFSFIALPSGYSSFDFDENGWLFSSSQFRFVSPIYCSIHYNIKGDNPDFSFVSVDVNPCKNMNFSSLPFARSSASPLYGYLPVVSNCSVTYAGHSVSIPSSFNSPVNAQFDFKSDLEFFCCLNDNVTALPVDNRVWIEVYDTLVAVETLVYKPYKYVYTNTITSTSPDVPNKHEQVIGDYLLANSVGPYYSISVDTLLHAGCKTDYFYTARAYVYNGSKPYEIANLTFKISSEGISTVDPSLKDPDNPDDPIMKTWNNDNRTYNYYNVNTGAEVDKDKLVYKFDSSVDPSVNGSGQDISDFDFNSDFSTDLTQGAGLVRTLFDKIIQSAGLSGFMITVLSVAVVGWFIFGSRR